MNSIYKKILKCEHLNIKEKCKRLLYYFSRKRKAKKAWDRKHNKVFELNSSYEEHCSRSMETEHKEKWTTFRENVDLRTLRISKNISGQADAKMIPEDIFLADIEPTLITDKVGYIYGHKSFYNQWFPNGIFPEGIFHCIEGQYLDAELSNINYKELTKRAERISYPVVFKPNWKSHGGNNVYFIDNSRALIRLCSENNNFVVQEKIVQHEFFSKYNPIGLNTLRVYTYKSVKDNTHHIINMALRMGKDGGLDNLTSGGIQTMIKDDGYLNSYAVDKHGQKYKKHPNTGYSFDDQIPAYDQMQELALKISKSIHFTRIVGLDLCFDEEGQWRAIEINNRSNSTRFAQYGGQPFFGSYTDEVINYCKNNHWALR